MQSPSICFDKKLWKTIILRAYCHFIENSNLCFKLIYEKSIFEEKMW